MIQQLPLALGVRTRQQLDTFVPGSNGATLAAIAKLLDGLESQLFLAGPPGAGKSHLLLGACATAEDQGMSTGYLPLAEHQHLTPELLTGFETLSLLAVDDVDQISGEALWEQALFGLYNRARTQGTRLLFAARNAPAALSLRLPDLRSRLAWGLSCAVRPLNDEGRRELLIAEARRRGLQLAREAADYLLARCSRNVKDLLQLLDDLDRAAMMEQRQLTRRFVSEYLHQRLGSK